MFLRNHWYVAAQPGEVGRAPLGRRILGDAIVMYRKENGSAVAMQDHCPHRKYALSKGRIEGDEIRCLYHGLKFDGTGACTFIPGQERIPASLRARTYPLREKHGWLWIWMGDPARADESRIADFGLNTDPAWRAVFGYLRIDSDYRLILDNFLDLTHVGYVHVGTIGNAPVSDAPFELLSDKGMVRFNRTMNNVPPSPTFVKLMQIEERIDRRTTSTWLPPSHFLNEVNAVPAGKPDSERAVRFSVNNSLTPETETTTHYFWAVTRNFRLGDASVGELLGRENNAAFQEDKVVIEEQQRMIAIEQPATPIMPVAADRGVLAMRRLLEKLEKEEAGTPFFVDTE
jgi:phenylpropionate dioxygenase-like ring-hydroxylating dioxygenase large terminal subunit